MWNFLHRLFGGRETQPETPVSPEECQTETVPETASHDENAHSENGRTFDITACDDIEVEEIDGELH